MIVDQFGGLWITQPIVALALGAATFALCAWAHYAGLEPEARAVQPCHGGPEPARDAAWHDSLVASLRRAVSAALGDAPGAASGRPLRRHGDLG